MSNEERDSVARAIAEKHTGLHSERDERFGRIYRAALRGYDSRNAEVDALSKLNSDGCDALAKAYAERDEWKARAEGAEATCAALRAEHRTLVEGTNGINALMDRTHKLVSELKEEEAAYERMNSRRIQRMGTSDRTQCFQDVPREVLSQIQENQAPADSQLRSDILTSGLRPEGQ